MAKQRRGMLIKNTNDRPVDIFMKTRPIRLNPGEEKFITADEVRDNAVREKLQIRAVSIVRPSTEAEEDDLMEQIEHEALLRAAAEAEQAEEEAEEAEES